MKYRTRLLWALWIVASLVVGAALAGVMFLGGDRADLVVGPTTDAHYQFEMSCESCHAAKPFASEKKMKKAMNKACVKCHKKELKVSNDSHPIKKFRDPRNADRLKNLNAKSCVTCHTEHKPEITRTSAVTLPEDFCTACHQDVGKNRPSHKGLEFTSCLTSGCHNYHDNRALYEDFLVKHATEPAMDPFPVNPAAAKLRADFAGNPLKRLTAAQAVAPVTYKTSQAVEEWAASDHAAAGVNCAGCHAPKLRGKKAMDLTLVTEKWTQTPTPKACKSCHRNQVTSFTEGKHASRQHPKMAKPRKLPKWAPKIASTVFSDSPLPQTFPVADARMAMRADAHDKAVGSCVACHAPHAEETSKNAVSACVACHDDGHSRAYFDSPHFSLWKAEITGTGKPGSGVSCGDCHMAKIEDDDSGDMFTTHNQNAYLRPNEKMIRPVCMACHGLAFSIDALADPALVANNFKGQPTRHIPSMDWAVKRVTEKAHGK